MPTCTRSPCPSPLTEYQPGRLTIVRKVFENPWAAQSLETPVIAAEENKKTRCNDREAHQPVHNTPRQSDLKITS